MSIEDKLYKLLKYYKNLPFPVKDVIGRLYRLVPKKLKYGGFYYLYLDRIKENPKSFDALLKQQLELATQQIPYYKNTNFETIQDFPLINKSIIINDLQSFINKENSNYIKANTGGSSGTPFEFYLEKGISRPKEKAHFDWLWSQFGYNENSKMLMIRGESLAGNKLYEYQAIENRLAISCYLINETNINKVVNIINKFNPEFIHAYPSAIKIFLESVDKSDAQLKLNIKAVFLGSEGLYPGDKKLIEQYFNTKVAHWYGHSERLIHAGNCPYTDEFHIFPFYGYAELIDDEGDVIYEAGKIGRIVATGFDNAVMPFIRYDTGDLAEYSLSNSCKCGFVGKSFSVIQGRAQNFIYLNDKTKVSLTAFMFGQHFDEFSFIEEFQLEQEIYGKLILRLIVKDHNEFNIACFKKKLLESVKGKLEIKIKFVEFIPKTIRGKQIPLIQKIHN